MRAGYLRRIPFSEPPMTTSPQALHIDGEGGARTRMAKRSQMEVISRLRLVD